MKSRPNASPPIRRVAELGNALALLAIVLVCANAWLLLAPPGERITFSPGQTGPKGAVVVIIDGFRADAVTGEIAPTLARYASSQALRRVRLDTLLPSTVSGIRGLIEGTVHPPLSFVNDFRAPAAARGGVIEGAHQQGMSVITAGPHLWHDLYGRWITRSLNVMGLARDDVMVLRAALRGIVDSEKPLIIAHFSGPDVAAHEHGAISREYRDRISWCDAAIRQIEVIAPPEMAIIVTGDHGLTRSGGHAGPEPDVLETLLVCNQPSLLAGLPDPVPQTELCTVIARAAGIEAREISSNRNLPTFPVLIGVIVGSLGSLWAIRQLACAVSVPANTAFNLNVAAWTSLGASWLSPVFGGALDLVTLLYCAIRTRSRGLHRAHDLRFVILFVAGVALAAVQISDAAFSSRYDLAAPASFTVIVLLSSACFAAPILCSRLTESPMVRLPAQYLGALGVVTAAVLARASGETASLSTLDVRSTFHLLANAYGLPLAAVTGAARPFLFPLLLIAGIAVGFRNPRFSMHLLRSIEGVTALLAGQLIAAAFALPILYSNGQISLAGYGFGLLIRVSAWIAVVFPAFALVIWLRRENRSGSAIHSAGFTSPREPATVRPR